MDMSLPAYVLKSVKPCKDALIAVIPEQHAAPEYQ
jgi:hypothetical protein